MGKAAKQARRSVVVTGAGSGIGEATAGLLIDEGWQVAFLDVREAALAAAKERHGKAKGVRFACVDVTDEDAVERAIAEINRELGGIHGVVSCAGVGLTKGLFETTAKEFRRVVDINLTGTFLVARAAARIMRDRQIAGSIVNIASISGIRGSLMRSAYGASKGGVINLTKVMANELAGLGIRVNAIAPGPVETEMVKVHHTDLDRRLYARTIPLARYAEPVEIAQAALFLLDNARSAYITAEVLAVDGGYRGAGLIDGRA